MNKQKLTVRNIINWTDLMLLSLNNNANNIEYTSLNQKLFLKFPKNDDCYINLKNKTQLKYVGFVHRPLNEIKTLPPTQIFLIFELLSSCEDMAGYSGSFIFKSSNNKIIGIFSNYDYEKKLLYCIPSIYLQKIIKEYNNGKINWEIPFLPIKLNVSTMEVLEEYDNLTKNDIILKVNDKNLNKQLCVYSHELGEYITVITYILLFFKCNDYINITIKRNDQILKKKILVSDFNVHSSFDTSLTLQLENHKNEILIKPNKVFFDYLGIIGYNNQKILDLIDKINFDNKKIILSNDKYCLFDELKNNNFRNFLIC